MFPAPAGINRIQGKSNRTVTCVPRVSGDKLGLYPLLHVGLNIPRTGANPALGWRDGGLRVSIKARQFCTHRNGEALCQ
ncbi:hypothetical protein PEC301877_29630 [Pectobacterium carotovorum subsp. carotovorum]|nr:hypothetical protein PEC301877_29630 [Pectobacterium carotovorum subsp. carotovorum]